MLGPVESAIPGLAPIRRLVCSGLVIGLFLAGSYPTHAQSGETPVPVHTMTAVGGTAIAGSQFIVSIELESGGDEYVGQFSVNFDPTKLRISNISNPGTNPDVSIGTGIPVNGASYGVNATQVSSGKLGLSIAAGSYFQASPPSRQLFRLRFTVLPDAPAGPTVVAFGDAPILRQFVGAPGIITPIPLTWIAGTINIQRPSVRVSGRVTGPTGVGLGNTLVTIAAGNHYRLAATTSPFGYYSFEAVPAGERYMISVLSRRYRFVTVQLFIDSDVTNLDFVGVE